MTRKEVLQEFSKLPIKQHLELLRAALEIVEANFEQAEAEESPEPLTTNFQKSE